MYVCRRKGTACVVICVLTAPLLLCRTQVEAIAKGFYATIPRGALALFTASEVENLVCGSPEVSVEELKKHTKSAYPATGSLMKNYWTVRRQQQAGCWSEGGGWLPFGSICVAG